ncbi:angiopoietin-4 [Zeugodacus cucurbitae]|uniref:angiopoietin-4 n=1 Tax=Zeugodacus cucurbitae TaxID=28588 RepID=UPI0005967BD0|nr:angiopoietin-4 [Zeugodacus cucurbitae]
MLHFRKQLLICSLLITALVQTPTISANRYERSANDADFMTIIVDETMRNLVKQCNKSVRAEAQTSELQQDQEMPVTMKQLGDLMQKTVSSLSDTFTKRLLLRFPKTCADILPPGVRDRDDVYSLHISGYTPINVYCLSDVDGGCPWTVVHRRQDKDTEFNLRWPDYKAGFGDPYKSFFVGMQSLFWLTSDEPQELRIVMRLNSDSVDEIANYDHFAIGDEGEQYALKMVGKFSGNASDELSKLIGYKFRTRDRVGYCIGKEKVGGWWKEGCAKSKLNGMYAPTKWEVKQQVGIIWDNKTTLGMNYSLEYVHMAIRPKYCLKIKTEL